MWPMAIAYVAIKKEDDDRGKNNVASEAVSK
jgi:hypothetical protein